MYDANNLCFSNRSFDESGSHNPGKEIKAETQTYYQGLIDNRDSPFVVSVGDRSLRQSSSLSS